MALSIHSIDRAHVQVSQDRSDPFAALPDEVAFEVLKNLSWTDLARCCQVSRHWKRLASDPALQMATCPRLGARAWKRLGIEVQEPQLHRGIVSILTSPCGFWEGKRVIETHRLVLIPQGLTLNFLREISPISCYRVKEDHVKTQVEGESYWALMTIDVIPGSRTKTYRDQKAMVTAHEGYMLPKVVEAVACVALEHAVTGQRIYSDRPWTYTRCQEVVEGKLPVFIGGFGSGGFFVKHDDNWAHHAYGVGALQKLS